MAYLSRRFTFYMVAFFIAITLNFLIPRLMVGDPVQMIVTRTQGQQMNTRALESLNAVFGFVQGPLLDQYFAYLTNLAHGQFGPSISSYPVPVADVIGPSLGWTLRLVGLATIFTFSIGTLLGIVAGWRRGGFVDSYLLPIFVVLNAFPYFWLATLVVYAFMFKLQWFPIGHAADIALTPDWGSWDYVSSVIQHAFLPMVTIVFTALGGWMLTMRNNMIGVLSEDYVVMAEAKGLSDRRVMFTYAARNALVPSLTGFAMSLGFLIGGELLTEIVFSYPGVGALLVQAAGARDYPLMQAIFFLITITVLVANFIADVAYVVLDPRAR